MGYENAPATKMLATHCACCRKELVDAKSVEIGMGPVCRKNHGYDAVLDLPEETRIEANKLIHAIACDRDGPNVLDALKRLFALGCTKVVTAILKRVATVKIALTDDTHPHGPGRLAVKTPYSEEVVAAMRNVPGRRWDKDGKVNTFPASSKVALFNLFKRFYPGATAVGPKGPFVIPEASVPNGVAFKTETRVAA